MSDLIDHAALHPATQLPDVWGITDAQALKAPRRWPAAVLAPFLPARAKPHPGAMRDRPALRHRWRAVTHLRLAVWEAVQPGASSVTLGDVSMEGLVSDEAVRAQMHGAFESAAARTGLASAEAVSGALQGMAEELAVLEALRERLPDRMQAAVRGLASGSQAGSVPAARIGREALAAMGQMRERFEAADGLVADILSCLGDVARFRRQMRACCTEIGRAEPAWEGLIEEVERWA